MKTAISIPDPVFREAEKAAKRLGISRSEFFTRAAQRLVASLRDDQVTASYNAAFEGAALATEIRFRQRASRRLLAAVEWDEE